MNQSHASHSEWLEVVDGDDRVVDRRRRADIHRLGLRHRATHVLLFNRQGLLFLQRRSQQKDINPGLWDTSAAGHVDPGESYDDCARRELSEELGIHCAPEALELLFKLPASETTGWEFIHVYRTVHDGPLQLNAEEIDDGMWLPPEAIDRWEDQEDRRLSATFRSLWACFRALSPVAG
ncbi:NUDIX domain-containing protein [Methylolobus aquaticus]|nr:NUDIX domain-containing protein [Methylolobus aquaticus]